MLTLEKSIGLRKVRTDSDRTERPPSDREDIGGMIEVKVINRVQVLIRTSCTELFLMESTTFLQTKHVCVSRSVVSSPST